MKPAIGCIRLIDIPNASFVNYTIADATNIGFRYYVNDASANEQGGYVFDNFRLTRLTPEIDDYTVCSGEKLNLTIPCPVNAVTYSWVPVGTPACMACLRNGNLSVGGHLHRCTQRRTTSGTR
ncbi:MAG: hypothetical protein KJS45_02700 [Bacteroidetes bacterium]|nr:hypothetical protein [Bacteroidota bacterium]